MAQVFISYRHVEPDQSLAAELANAVGKEHRVFIDNQIPLGRQWGDIIREHLEDADFLTALVSQNSAKSPMVLAEIEQARQLNVAKKRPGIIPIRLRFDVPSRSPNRFTMTCCYNILLVEEKAVSC